MANADEYVAEGFNGWLYRRIRDGISIAVKKSKFPGGFAADEIEGLNRVKELGSREHLMRVLEVGEDELLFEWIEGLPLDQRGQSN